MKGMTKTLGSSRGCKVVALNIGFGDPSGMMSYPNFGGSDRVTRNPDVVSLARLAEAAGADLRIVLLTRRPTSIIQSELERSYEPDASHAARKISMTMALLSKQLDLIDPSYVTCWRYEDPSARTEELLSFMGLCKEDPREVRKIIQETYRPANHSLLTKRVDEILDTGARIHESLVTKWCN